MADNTRLNAGVGGDLLALDDDGTAKHQWVKVEWGADNDYNPVTKAVPMPVGGNLAADGTGNLVPFLVDAAGHSQIDVLSCASHPVTNAGTFVVQENGAALTALQIMDDWDESDRAKVNPIAGQAGIAAGTGAMGVTVPRVTLATDDPAVVDLAAIEVLQTTIAGDTTSMDGKITACNTGAVVITTVPAPLNVVGGGTEATALRVTMANDSTGLVSVDDNGGTLTVDCLSEVVLGTATYTETTSRGLFVAAVRNDDLATLANTDNEAAPLQVNKSGALFTEPAQQVDYVFDGSEQCTVKRFSGLAPGGGAAVMVAAVATKKIRVRSLAIVATSTTVTNVYIYNVDNDIIGDTNNRIPIDGNGGDGVGGLVLNLNTDGWFETDAVNEALSIGVDIAEDVIFLGTYIEVA